MASKRSSLVMSSPNGQIWSEEKLIQRSRQGLKSEALFPSQSCLGKPRTKFFGIWDMVKNAEQQTPFFPSSWNRLRLLPSIFCKRPLLRSGSLWNLELTEWNFYRSSDLNPFICNYKELTDEPVDAFTSSMGCLCPGTGTGRLQEPLWGEDRAAPCWTWMVLASSSWLPCCRTLLSLSVKLFEKYTGKTVPGSKEWGRKWETAPRAAKSWNEEVVVGQLLFSSQSRGGGGERAAGCRSCSWPWSAHRGFKEAI